MSDCTIRVELHAASATDYTKLHDEMEARKFSRFITSDDGILYELPPAEYYYCGPLNREGVFNNAKTAAALVKPGYEVFVTEAVGWTWCGLKRVR